MLANTEPFKSNGTVIYNRGIGGNRTDQMIVDFPNDVAPLYDPSKLCLYIVNEIGNDIYIHGNEVTAVADFWTLCDMAKATGFKVLAANVFDRSITYYGPYTTFGDNNTQYRAKLAWCNAQLLAYWKLHAHYHIDLKAATELSNAYNLTYFVDQTHLTTAGKAAHNREYRNAILTYTGNSDLI